MYSKKDTVSKILRENLDMSKFCAKIIPQNLTHEQKDNLKKYYPDIMEWLTEEKFLLTNVMSLDYTWVFENDPKTKRESKSPKTPTTWRIKKARMSKSKREAMLIIFVDIKGIIMTECESESQTAIHKYVREFPINLLE